MAVLTLEDGTTPLTLEDGTTPLTLEDAWGEGIAELASATGTAATPSVAITPNAELAGATGAALDPTINLGDAFAMAECASATGAALDPMATTAASATAECASATGAALDPTVSIAPGIEVATATGAALDPSRSVAVGAGIALGDSALNDGWAITTDVTGVWRIEVYDRATWSVVGHLPSGKPRRYCKRRRDIGWADIEFSIWDPVAIEHLPRRGTLRREIRLLRDGVLVWHGIPGAWRGGSGPQRVSMRCLTHEAIWAGKVFGRADRENLLVNGDFEDDPVSIGPWTEVGDVAASIETTIVNEDDRACRLTSATGVGYIEQTLATPINHSYDPGLAIYLAGWEYLEDTVVDRTNLIQLEATGAHPDSPVRNEFVSDPTFGVGGYRPVATSLLLSADIAWTIKARIFAIAGDTIADSFRVFFNDATTVTFPGEDLRVLIEHALEYSQDVSLGQSNEGIGHSIPTTGIVVMRGWEHGRHENLWASLRQLMEDYDVDLWVNSARTWELSTARGTHRPGLAVTIDGDDPGDNFDFTVEGDPAKVWTSIIAFLENDQFKEESGAVDTSELDGMVRTKVVRAPVSSTVRAIGEFAENTVARESKPADLPTLTFKHTTANPVHGVVEPADTVDFTVTNMGWLDQATARFRIETLEGDCETDSISCTFDERVLA